MTEPMTPKMFAVTMKGITGDLEMSLEEEHRLADQLLYDMLYELGYGDGAAIYLRAANEVRL